MSKQRSGNFFEDFHLGQRFAHATPRTLGLADQSLYIALTGSRACLHSADTTAQALGFARRPIEDLLVFNTAFGKTVPDISLNAVANLGYAELRFLEPVFDGDTLGVESEVIGLKENANRRSGVVYVRSSARNQHGREVLGWVRWVMVHKRDAAAACGEPVLPSLAAHVAPDALALQVFGEQVASAPRVTGCSDQYEDYAVGERIDHPAAMTLNDSDHSLATRLYQNTAKAHFDAATMARSPMQRRLVYGGHVMSICKALAYDGFENLLSILAIHGGRHVAPTFAGDTLRCATQVVECLDFEGAPVGALRLRMVGAKNVEATEQIRFTAPSEPPDPHTVLDLDLTVALPKKRIHRQHP
ncbi:MaoC family dehydratase [Variovorax sp. J22P168]|uniref:MaoC family dehydratase n=1 Tax=Variovorax jilinensis TaxID=3053513 RepID=UPI00257598E6|nr:MaoC family dehydratase [Variovorax sp. J22P168]MDM0015342.1 MaoC family dehydratase [Variovorax sp. J22P168]